MILLKKEITSKDIDDVKRIHELFQVLSEKDKIKAIVYLSALRDKEIADSTDNTNLTKLA